MIFQDRISSLNPRRPVIDLIGQNLEIHGVAKGPRALRNASPNC